MRRGRNKADGGFLIVMNDCWAFTMTQVYFPVPPAAYFIDAVTEAQRWRRVPKELTQVRPTPELAVLTL